MTWRIRRTLLTFTRIVAVRNGAGEPSVLKNVRPVSGIGVPETAESTVVLTVAR
jgi:hypothetical protein